MIGDVARRSGVSARMLRHYDSLGLVRPTERTEAGYREYSGEDIRRIFHIESLRSLGLSLREVRSALDDPGFRPAELVDDLIRQTRERIAGETALLTRLRRIGAAEPAEWEDVLQTVALLQALGSESAGKRQRAALSSVDEVSVPVEALVEAVLSETDPNVAGALRWALAQSGDSVVALLAEGLDSPVADVRKRAVQSIAEFPDDDASATAAGRPHELRHRGPQVCRSGARSTRGGRGGPDAHRHDHRGGARRRSRRCTRHVGESSCVGRADRFRARRPSRPRGPGTGCTPTPDTGARGHPGDHDVRCPRRSVPATRTVPWRSPPPTCSRCAAPRSGPGPRVRRPRARSGS